MAEQAYAYVTLIPVAKGFQKQVAKQLDGVGGAGGKAGQVTGKNFSDGFGGQLKKLGLLAAGALATAGVGRLLGDSIKQASDLGESLNAVNVVFEESAAGIAKIGETASQSLGLSQTEFNQAAVQFSSFAQKIAGEGGDVVGTISDLTQRGADFASVMNLEVSEALQVFQSGLAGETEPLKKFGIDLSAASVEAYALEAGIIASGESMTETQKVQARYGALLEQTAKTQGDFANTSDSLANRQRILQAEFTNLQASVGQALVPVMERLLGVVAERVLPAFEDFGNWLESPEGTQAVETLSDAIVGLAEFLINVTTAVVEQLPVLTALGAAYLLTTGRLTAQTVATGAATAAQIALNAAMAANPIGLLITALGLAVVGVTAFMNANEAATPTQDELKQSIADTTKELEFYREEQSKTENTKLYESRIRELEDALRDQRAALQESYNWTQAQTDASYDARDAAIANRIASQDLKPALDKNRDSYTDLAFAATNAKLGIESVTVAEEAQRRMQEQFTGAVNLKTLKSYEEILLEVTASTIGITKEQQEFNEAARLLAIEMGRIVPGMEQATTSTTNYTGSTQNSTDAVINQDGAIKNLTGTYEGAAGAIDQATAALGRFAGATPGDPGPGGLFPVQGPGGEYLASLDDSVRGQLSVIEGNLAKEFGTQAVDRILEQSLGGTSKVIENTLRRGTQFVNEETGRVITGNVQGRRAEELIAEGFTEVGKVSASNEDLTKAIEQLSDDISSGNVANYTPFAKGGLVTGPTRALIGEAGPEVVIPLNRFENMMDTGSGKTLVYNAAPNESMDSEQELFTAMRRAKVVANW